MADEPNETQEASEIHQLVYASAATHSMDEEELAQILGSARENNGALGITGMLLYHEGSFLQVLEGEKSAVEALFAKIEKDERHTETLVLLRADVEERSFRRWSMGFYCSASNEELPGLNEFLQKGSSARTKARRADGARQLLNAFREGRWRRQVESD